MIISDDLCNRIKKRFTHVKKWAKRNQISCFRIYDKDLVEFPIICDWYDGDVVVWLYDRKKDETLVQKTQFKSVVKASVIQALTLVESQLHIKHRRRQKGFQYKKLSQVKKIKVVKESDLYFEVNLSDYLDTGLFLDHRYTRKLCRELSKGKRVLNCFSYTGAFTVYAILGGAISTTSVDLNKNYMAWAERNLAHNQLIKRPSDRMITDNCLSFLKNEAANNRYDVIICDPPTFSDSKKMKQSFNIDDHYVELLHDCNRLLSEQGVILFSTNSRSFKMDEARLPSRLSIQNITHKTLPEDFKQNKVHQCWLLKVG